MAAFVEVAVFDLLSITRAHTPQQGRLAHTNTPRGSTGGTGIALSAFGMTQAFRQYAYLSILGVFWAKTAVPSGGSACQRATRCQQSMERAQFLNSDSVTYLLLVVPMHALHTLMLLLCFDRHGRDWASLQSPDADWLIGLLAIPVGPNLDPYQRLIDF